MFDIWVYTGKIQSHYLTAEWSFITPVYYGVGEEAGSKIHTTKEF